MQMNDLHVFFFGLVLLLLAGKALVVLVQVSTRHTATYVCTQLVRVAGQLPKLGKVLLAVAIAGFLIPIFLGLLLGAVVLFPCRASAYLVTGTP